MKNIIRTLAVVGVIIGVGITAIFAQKAKPLAPYTITDIKVVPFDEVLGQWREPVTPDQWFGNDLSVSLLATIELKGPAGEFAENRRVQINVTEGKKVKLTRLAYPGVMSETGKFYVPVFIYGPLCDIVKITATVTGQTKKSSRSRNVNFHCGE
jgi:hypothetical protein